MKNLTYLAAAYGIVWAGLFGYLWHISSRQVNLMRRLRALEDSE